MILDGKKIAKEIRDELKKKIELFSLKRKPNLAVILVGNNEASKIYIRNKRKACENVGITSTLFHLPETIQEKELLAKIVSCNQDAEIDGILLQLPLPSQIVSQKMLEAISPEKDVDGFHPINMGKLLLGDTTGFIPCTAKGIQVLIEKAGVEISGKHVVICGRSNIVGKPLAALLIQKAKGANATVTLTHSLTKNLSFYTRQADILVAAMGKPHFITKDMVKDGAVVVDVGTNPLTLDHPSEKKMVGDVFFEEVFEKCSLITPVPGGVGPMTVAMLLENTWESFCKRHA